MDRLYSEPLSVCRSFETLSVCRESVRVPKTTTKALRGHNRADYMRGGVHDRLDTEAIKEDVAGS